MVGRGSRTTEGISSFQGDLLPRATPGRKARRAVRPRRPIFIATLRAVASWRFFGVARSLRINSDMVVAPPAPLREALRAWSRLENSQLTDGETHVIYGTEHQYLFNNSIVQSC